MMAVAVSTEGAFSAGPPEPVFESLDRSRDFRFGVGEFSSYDVSADGGRFLVIKAVPSEETSEPRTAQTSIHVVENWYEEFHDRE